MLHFSIQIPTINLYLPFHFSELTQIESSGNATKLQILRGRMTRRKRGARAEQQSTGLLHIFRMTAWTMSLKRHRDRLLLQSMFHYPPILQRSLGVTGDGGRMVYETSQINIIRTEKMMSGVGCILFVKSMWDSIGVMGYLGHDGI
jgi:hypothetical protein